MDRKQKLELTWIGKYDEIKVEPRILLEDKSKGYGDPNAENMLIHGDNLLALKALEQDFAGKIKCIYIDPPFNTGAAFEHYDDGVEHSLWLNLMYQRIKMLYRLLDKNGVIFVHLDDNEVDYCKVILDEIFGRENFVNRITIDARSPSAFSTVNPGVFKASEYILWYAKNKSSWNSRSLRIPSKRDTAYNKYIVNRDLSEDNWRFIPLKIAFLEYWNQDRIEIIKIFLEKAFKELKNKPKKYIKDYISKEFPLAQVINITQVSNYLSTKLKINEFFEFYYFCYPYLLEKCTYLYSDKDIDLFVYENATAVCRETEIDDEGAGRDIVELKYKSINHPEKVLKLERGQDLDTVYIKNGKQISFYNKNVEEIDGKLTATKLLTNIWTDISWEGIAKEGNVNFKKGKKPERLLQRIISLSTDPNEYVLDSFLGSGTTAAVAHKMGRRWIGIELGDHCYTHCLPRLKAVVDGEQGGISKAVNWQGGGGFRFFELAPSLLKKDKYGNWIIDECYNADMLAAAMAKHQGFTYSPDSEVFWKQGYSFEKDYIFTTTQFVTLEYLELIHQEMAEDESLLICCKAFQDGADQRYENINVKKIPQVLLNKCDFGVESYSLNIVGLPEIDEEVDDNE